MTTAAGSGHSTSCLSCADLVAALFFHEMRWDPSAPGARDMDRCLLSKGHAAPILWAALHEAGAIDSDPLSLRRLDSDIEGHPTPENPWVSVATGSLGQGLSVANGLALADRMDGIEARIFCLLGDGECSEGAVWEAAEFAADNRLERVVAMVDVDYAKGAQVAARHAFGNALKSLGSQVDDLVVLDGDAKKSTKTEDFAQAFAARLIEARIAEQNPGGSGDHGPRRVGGAPSAARARPARPRHRRPTS